MNRKFLTINQDIVVLVINALKKILTKFDVKIHIQSINYQLRFYTIQELNLTRDLLTFSRKVLKLKMKEVHQSKLRVILKHYSNLKHKISKAEN